MRPPEKRSRGRMRAALACLGVLAGACTLDAQGTRDEQQNDSPPTCETRVGQACETGMAGACAKGTIDCGGGVETCAPLVMPGTVQEQCNGLDDDCDGTIDEPSGPGPGAQGCPCPIATYSGHTYMFCNDTKIWDDARSFCHNSGYHLVTFNDADENSWAYLVAENELGGNRWWIGYNDLSEEGTWLWEGGTSDYVNWAMGDPNGGLGQNCALMRWFEEDTWVDIECDSEFRFVCEADG